jgi:uncharacterized protein DUF6249
VDDLSISPLMIPIVGILVPISAIVGVFIYVIVRTMAQARVRELEVRERIAMIERGLVPPPEKDPQGFDRAMGHYDRYRGREDDDEWPRRRSPGRYRRSGITMIGVGFGLMLLIGVAGESMNAALGVGGFLVVMGVAFFLNSLFERTSYESRPYAMPRQTPPPGPPAGTPPSFGGGDQPPRSS